MKTRIIASIARVVLTVLVIVGAAIVIGAIPQSDGYFIWHDRVAWDDLRVPLTAGKLGVTNPPAFAQWKTDGSGSPGIYAHEFADESVAGNEDEIFFSAQIPHSYKEGTDIDFHVHWTPAVNGDLNEYAKWGLEYVWVSEGETTAANTTIISSNAATGATATTSGDTTLLAGKHYVTELGDLDGTGMTISSMLICRFFRNSSANDDDLDEDALAFECDFHFQINTPGSREEDAKGL